MRYVIRAACISNTGEIRSNNEDNFLFTGIILDEKHRSMEVPIAHKAWLYRTSIFGVFDGMGGETCGELASYTAAECARRAWMRAPKKHCAVGDFLMKMCQDMNVAIFRQAEKLHITRMGSTAAMLCLAGRYAHICNLGDSKVFRLRGGILEQISVDHTDAQELKKRGINRKARLTQHLGIDPNEMVLEPYIVSFPVKRKDYYLLCSDGLTDMLCNEDIQQTIQTSNNVSNCVEQLVQKALNNGGKDNITVIAIRIN